MLIGEGILGWDGAERRSRRYGYFELYPHQHDGYGNPVNVTHAAFEDGEAVQRLIGQRVHLVAEVIGTRTSNHAGDGFLQLLPTTPELGETLSLGVGILSCPGPRSYGLIPADGRKELWLDPRILYRLHEQTVRLFGEVTEAEFSPAPDLAFAPAGVLANRDGSFQCSGEVLQDGDVLYKQLAPGMRQISGFERGEQVEILRIRR